MGPTQRFWHFVRPLFFKKRENVNICFVTRETQNGCSWTRDETPPLAPPLSTTSQDHSSEKRTRSHTS